MATKTFVTDKDGATADASSITMPSDRHFRNAWKLSGTVMAEDMTAAKVIFKDKIREVRKPLLEAEDVTYMKALEADDASAKTASVAKKKALRDAPAATAKEALLISGCVPPGQIVTPGSDISPPLIM